jgi:hypothetical protein
MQLSTVCIPLLLIPLSLVVIKLTTLSSPAAQKVGHFLKTTGAKIAKVALKIVATVGKIAAKVRPSYFLLLVTSPCSFFSLYYDSTLSTTRIS